MGWIIASLFFYFCAYLAIVDTTELGDEKPLVLLIFLVVATILLVVFIRKRVNSVREKRRTEEEKARIAQEKKAKEEQEAKEKAERERIEKEQFERFCHGLNTNPIITTAVPAVAKQCAQELIERHRTEQYLEKGYDIIASNKNIAILNITTIPYAKYGFPAIGTAEIFKIAQIAAEKFANVIKNELATEGIQVDYSLEQVIDYYTRERKPNYYLVFKIGSLRSW